MCFVFPGIDKNLLVGHGDSWQTKFCAKERKFALQYLLCGSTSFFHIRCQIKKVTDLKHFKFDQRDQVAQILFTINFSCLLFKERGGNNVHDLKENSLLLKKKQGVWQVKANISHPDSPQGGGNILVTDARKDTWRSSSSL